MKLKGVILAAGKGTRLYPVTKVIPKALLPIANRMTLDYAFEQMKACGIEDVCIVAGENESDLREGLGDGSDFGVRLSYARQPEAKGLAHAVGFAREFVGDAPFMLYLGDAIYDTSLVEHVEKFKATGAVNLNLVKEVDDPRRFGVANVEGDRIVKLVEKPQEPESNLAMAGMYLFTSEIWEYLPKVEPSARGEYEITDAIQLLVDAGLDVRASVYTGDWFDTGTLPSYLSTHDSLIKGGTCIAEGAVLEGEIGSNVTVGEGGRVKCAHIQNSVVLPGAVVEATGRINGSVIGGEVSRDGSIEGEVLYGDVE